MTIILSMILSSGILFLLFLFIDKFYEYLFTQRLRYFILKVSLFLNIIPLGYMINLLEKKFNFKFIDAANKLNTNFFYGDKPTIIISLEEHKYNTAFKIENFILIVWFTVLILIFFHHLWKIIKLRKDISCIAHKVTSPKILNIRDNYQSKLQIKQKVQIYHINKDIAPFTIGIFNPIIVIPKIKNISQIDLIICHELNHIKNKDGLILFFRSLIIGIYWFNPLVYFLNFHLERICELACDESVLKYLDPEKRKEYADLIIKQATNNTDLPKKTIIAFSDNKKLITERIDFIMKEKAQKNKAAIFLAAGLILSSVIPAFAYEPVQKIEYQSQDNVVISLSSPKDFFSFSNVDIFEEPIDVIYYDNQFTDVYGNVYDMNTPISHASCEHTYKSGIATLHDKDSEGGCTLSKYNAQQCTKCGYYILGSLISEFKYAKCPH